MERSFWGLFVVVGGTILIVGLKIALAQHGRTFEVPLLDPVFDRLVQLVSELAQSLQIHWGI